ncbi:MAG: ferredoxin [Desulfosoma sp.]
MRRPVVDLSECVDCEGCISVCPQVFVRNEAGCIQVQECATYPEALVEEAMMMCPSQCIFWEEDEELP